MAKRGKLFKKGASYIVEKSVGKIEASKEVMGFSDHRRIQD